MLYGFSRIMTVLFDAVLAPFGSGNAGLALAIVSLLVGILLIYVFKWTSNQQRIRETRDQFKARILEMRIYQDDIVLIMKALFASLATNLTYLRVSIRPIVVLVIIVLPIFVQLDERFGRRHLDAGETTLLTVTLKDGVDAATVPVSLEAGSNVAVDSRPVRVPSKAEVNWRLRATAAGNDNLTVTVYDKPYTFPVVTERTHAPKGHTRTANSILDPLIYPSLPMISKELPIKSVEIRYPSVNHSLFGWHTHWLVIFIVFSLVGALIPKFLFGIQI